MTAQTKFATRSQYLATATFHEKMVKVYDAAGKKKDAASARRAASLARAHARSHAGE